MKDRLPKYPGRVTLTPVPGQANTYDMKRADEPIVVGTPLNKGTLASDTVLAQLGLPDTATPNDAFREIVTLIKGAHTNITQILPKSAWAVEGDSGYKANMVINGLKGSDIVLADVQTSGTVATAKKELKAWSRIARIDVMPNTLVLHSIFGKPEADLKIALEVIR